MNECSPAELADKNR